MLFLLLIGYGLFSMCKFIAEKHQIPTKKAIQATLSIVLIIVLAVMGIKSIAYYHEKHLAEPLVDEVVSKLTADTIQMLKNETAFRSGKENRMKNKQLPASIENVVRQVLDAENIKAGMEVRLLIPVDEKDYIYLCKNPRFVYADTRPLKEESGAEIIDYNEISKMVKMKTDYSTPLFGNWDAGLFGLFMYSGNYIQGKVILSASGEIDALIVVDRD